MWKYFSIDKFELFKRIHIKSDIRSIGLAPNSNMFILGFNGKVLVLD